MFLKKTTTKGKTYWKIVESYREKGTGKNKHRLVQYLGETRKAYEIIRNDEKLKYTQNIIDRIHQQLMIDETYKDTETKLVRTCLRYVGGKARKKDKYTELMPEHRTFVSLFTGGASVELWKEPSKIEVINDVNDELVNLLNIIRDNPKELVEKAMKMPYSEQLYKQLENGYMTGNELDRAVRYFYLCRCSFNGGGGRYKTGISLQTGNTLKNPAKEYQNAVKLIENMSKRMANWTILSRDFKEIIERYDSPNTFFFADPPYFNRENYYKGVFTKEDHAELNRIAKEIKGKIMICYDNKHQYIDKIYDTEEFIRVAFDNKIYMTNKEKGEKCKESQEVIYMNYKIE